MAEGYGTDEEELADGVDAARKGYINPYTRRVLAEQEAISKLESEPVPEMFSPSQTLLRRTMNEVQRRNAMAMSMSGDKPTEAVGGKMLEEAIRASRPHYTTTGEYDPMAGRLTQYPEVIRQNELNRRGRNLSSLEAKEAGAAQSAQLQQEREINRLELQRRDQEARAAGRAADIRLKNARAQAAEDLAARGKDVTGKPHEELSKLGQGMSDFYTLRNRFDKEWTGAAGGFSILGKAGDVAYGVNPQLVSKKIATDRDIWSDVQRLVEAVKRHELFGATLTDNEIQNWLALTPPRGSSAAQMKDWIDKGIARAQEDINARAGSAAAAGGSHTQLETITRGYWKRPEKPKAEPTSGIPGESTEVRNWNPATGDVEG